jgi:DnaJ family protein C protein 7
MMLERCVEAISDCDKAIGISPKSYRLLDRKGRAFLKLGNFIEAEANFTALDRDADEENLKRDARAGLELIKEAQILIDKLSAWSLLLANTAQSIADSKGYLQQAEQLLAICTQYRPAHVFKVNALCSLAHWEEAKVYAEDITRATHSTVQELFSQYGAAFRVPPSSELQWSIGLDELLKYPDSDSVATAMLCMGPQLARVYVKTIKNLKNSQNNCKKVVDVLLNTFCRIEEVVSKQKEWNWLAEEQSIFCEHVDIKTVADEKFRSGQYLEAAALYSEALKKDPEAVRWNAVLYCNRAAAHMNDGKFADAVSDCNQALARDSCITLALLRRARSQKALGNIIMSIRDYRRYLSAKPRPVDAEEVDMELDELLELECGEGVAADTSSSGAAVKGAALNVPQNFPLESVQQELNATSSNSFVNKLSDVSNYSISVSILFYTS